MAENAPNTQAAPVTTPAQPVTPPVSAQPALDPTIANTTTQVPVNEGVLAQQEAAPFAASNTDIAQQIKTASQPTPPPPPPKHPTLLAMIQGIGIGLSSAGAAIGSHGREGGAPEVQQYYAQQQQQKIQAQQAAQEQKNQHIQNLKTVYDTNEKQINAIMNLHTIPLQITADQLKVAQEQQALSTGAQAAKIQLADFEKQNWGLTPDQATGTTPTSVGDMSKSKSMLDRAVNGPTGAIQILGPNHPAIIAAQKVAADPNPSPQDIMSAGQGLTVAMEQNKEVTAANTAKGVEAENAPLGDKAAQINAALLSRYQVLNPSAKTLPSGYLMSPTSVPKDFDRIDKIMQQTENAQSTQATRNLTDSIRQQTLSLLKGPSGIDPTATGQAYLDQLKTADPAQSALLAGYASGKLEIPPNATRTVQGQALLKQILRGYPDFDPSLAPAYVKLRQNFTSGPIGIAINSYNTAIGHLGTMFDHVSGANTAELNLPTSDVHRQLDLDKQLVSTELAKAVSNGQMTEGEKNGILGSISGLTSASYKTRIQEAVSLLNSKLGSFQDQWKKGTPKNVEPFPILSPESQSTVQKITGGTSVAPTAATGTNSFFGQFGGVAH